MGNGSLETGLMMLSLPTSCLALYCLVCYDVKQLPPPWKELLQYDGLEPSETMRNASLLPGKFLLGLSSQLCQSRQ